MQLIETVAGDGQTVGLTFDDGPNPPDTDRLLSVLRAHEVKAVFCLVGDRVIQYPDVARAIAAEGHVIGNHSMHHDNLSDWSPDDIEADLRETNEAIHQAIPGVSVPYFRAPYGHWGQSPEVARALGMESLSWRLSVEDWVPPGTATLISRLREGITPGAVVLLHDGGGDRSQTVDAVAALIPELRPQGWRFALPEHRRWSTGASPW